jgi:hypothetical protein
MDLITYIIDATCMFIFMANMDDVRFFKCSEYSNGGLIPKYNVLFCPFFQRFFFLAFEEKGMIPPCYVSLVDSTMVKILGFTCTF